ncbi:MAG: hypothetical protein LBE91_04255, partial [Tannerella sp.]|nr:hypothetical protein [Tannerella sp.]
MAKRNIVRIFHAKGINLFKGMITGASVTGHHGGQNHIRISGCSPTAKLDGSKTMDSFMDMDLENPAERQSRMTGFAGMPFLPLIIRDKITETTEKGCRYEIKSEGKIDEKLFDRKKYVTFVRKLRDE